MKKFLASTVLVALAAIGPASAADMALKAPPPVTYDWTGFYVGANIGYSWGRMDASSNQGVFNFESTTASSHLNGWLGGIQIGYNKQFSNPWVVGVESDIQATGERASRTWTDPGVAPTTCPPGFVGIPPNCVPFNPSFVPQLPGTGPASLSSTWRFPWFGTFRGRVGVTPDAARKWLLYVTGGLAVGETEYSFSWSNPGGAPGRQAYSLSNDRISWGWAVGAGIEAALKGNWTAKVEYLYINLCPQSVNALDVDGAPFNVRNKFQDQILRAGLNYRL